MDRTSSAFIHTVQLIGYRTPLWVRVVWLPWLCLKVGQYSGILCDSTLNFDLRLRLNFSSLEGGFVWRRGEKTRSWCYRRWHIQWFGLWFKCRPLRHSKGLHNRLSTRLRICQLEGRSRGNFGFLKIPFHWEILVDFEQKKINFQLSYDFPKGTTAVLKTNIKTFEITETVRPIASSVPMDTA